MKCLGWHWACSRCMAHTKHPVVLWMILVFFVGDVQMSASFSVAAFAPM